MRWCLRRWNWSWRSACLFPGTVCTSGDTVAPRRRYERSRHLPRNTFVFRTDARGYYEHIDQHRMLEQLARYAKDRTLLNLLWQAMRRSVTWGGLYRDCERGISRGCPLSPLLGAFHLYQLDRAMEHSGLFRNVSTC